MTGSRLDTLMSVYLAARGKPEAPSPEDLCRDCPELLPDFRRRVAAVEYGDALLGTGAYERETVESPAGGATPQLGAYRILKELGRGGMGAVLEADDPTLGRRVAVKVMLPQVATDPAARERFLREARAAAAVRHDHVVPIFHVGEQDGVPYLVMPLLEGESLETRLSRGPLPPAEVARVGREAALGLAAAHAKGLVHRDVKPANLWLEAPNGRVLVLDFGLARAADRGEGPTKPGSVLGTPAYMSPEQADGKELDARSDLFSLGATLYQAATGVVPFRRETLTAVLRAVVEHHPPPPHEIAPAVPAGLSHLILRLMAKTPTGRPASAADVAAALADGPPAPSGETVTMVRPAPTEPRSRRVVWVPVGVVLAALLVAGVWCGTRPLQFQGTPEHAGPQKPDPTPVRYRGRLDVLVERVVDGRPVLLRLNEPGALPLKQTDKFRIEGEVDPPAYLYAVWVDPDREVTPVYPWDASIERGPRPATEQPTGKVSLPPNAGERYTAPAAKPGVATMVLFARPTPLPDGDDAVRAWFESLPDLPLPPGGDRAAVWFDDYAEVKDPLRLRTFGVAGSDDPFARWQGRLQTSLGGKASFQTAVSFARTGGK